jgi:dTDP-glucose 4,6-dehydratase
MRERPVALSPCLKFVKTVLVTGGAGFIGSTLVRFLVAGGRYRVVTVDKLTYAGHLGSLAGVLDTPAHRFERADICDGEALALVFAEHDPSAVVHLAAESHVDRSIDAPAPFIQTNIAGTGSLLDACTRHWRGLAADRARDFRFVHVSTDEVFGSLGENGLFAEGAAYAPRSPYSASKAGADHLVRAWHHTYGLPTLVAHSSNNYGPFQFPDKFVPLMIQRALEGRSLPLYGDGRNVRDWLFVEDHARALQLLLERGQVGASYHVGAGNERSNRAMLESICRVVDAQVPNATIPDRRALIAPVPDRPGHDFRYAMDTTRMRVELGWAPRVSLEDGLQQTVGWQLQHQPWIAAVQGGRYDGERFGLTDGR